MCKKLSELHERFCCHIVLDPFNQGDAYINAGYKARTDNAAYAGASRLLRKDKIQARIAQLRKERDKRVQSDADRVIRELKQIAYSDIRKLFDEKGNLKPIHELDDETAAAIGGIDIHELRSRNTDALIRNFVRKVKLIDKIRALEMLAKHHGLFAPERHDVTGEIKITVETVDYDEGKPDNSDN